MRRMIAAKSFVALGKFQHSSDAAVAKIGVDASHVRVQVGNPIANSGDRQGVTDQARTFKSAKNLATGVGRHDKGGDRFDFEVGFLPDFPLQRHAKVKFVERLALADDDVRSSSVGGADAGVLRFRGLRFAVGRFLRIACSFFRCVSLRPTTILFPREAFHRMCGHSARAAFSISMKRRRNFALAFLSAISGSTCTNLARFTAAKSRSPSSSSAFLKSFSASA